MIHYGKDGYTACGDDGDYLSSKYPERRAVYIKDGGAIDCGWCKMIVRSNIFQAPILKRNQEA